MPILSQGMVTPAGRKRLLGSAPSQAHKGVCSRAGPGTLTRHSTQMPQNGPGIVREDSEVPSMPEEHIKHTVTPPPNAGRSPEPRRAGSYSL